MFHQRIDDKWVVLLAIAGATFAGCQVPGNHFGGEALQLRAASRMNKTIRLEKRNQSVPGPAKPRRSAESRTIILAAK